MVALNFQTRFAVAVRAGIKTQTIRKARKRRIKKGDLLQLYTGQRTSNCKKLGDAVCTSVETITLFKERPGLQEIALADGFADASDMLDWFQHMHGLPFTGHLITWRLREGAD